MCVVCVCVMYVVLITHSPEYESSHQHYCKAVNKATQSEYDLPHYNESTEHHGAYPDPKHPIQKEPSEDREDDVGPRVERVKERILGSINAHHLGGGGGGGRSIMKLMLFCSSQLRA